jgi:hypothetical protein
VDFEVEAALAEAGSTVVAEAGGKHDHKNIHNDFCRDFCHDWRREGIWAGASGGAGYDSSSQDCASGGSEDPAEDV